MGQDRREQIYIRLSQKETAELLEIWQAKDRATWTDTAFDVIREILQERQVELPPQGTPVGPALPPQEAAAARVDPKMGGSNRILLSLLTGLAFLAGALFSIFLLGEDAPPDRTAQVLLAVLSFVWGACAGLLLSFGISLLRSRPTKADRSAGALFVVAVVLCWLGISVMPLCAVFAFISAWAA